MGCVHRLANNTSCLTNRKQTMTLEKIDYVEFPARDFSATKTFFQNVFEWTFTDYGDDYTAFSNAGVGGGFYKSENASITSNGGALIVLLSDDLEATQKKVEAAGGIIVKQIFSFPGGRRFQFTEPSGNEFGVWALASED